MIDETLKSDIMFFLKMILFPPTLDSFVGPAVHGRGADPLFLCRRLFRLTAQNRK